MTKLSLYCTRRGETGGPIERAWPDTSIRSVEVVQGEIEVVLHQAEGYSPEVYVARAETKIPSVGVTNMQNYFRWATS